MIEFNNFYFIVLKEISNTLYFMLVLVIVLHTF